MEIPAVLATVGLAALGLVGYVVLDVLGMTAVDGYADTADDARALGIATAVLAVAGCGLLALWWRRAGAPRHY